MIKAKDWNEKQAKDQEPKSGKQDSRGQEAGDYDFYCNISIVTVFVL